MDKEINNNKKILKNTFVLYIRMGCTMLISFFTTRELLLALGVVNFGLVNVIGSMVTMFSFLSGIMQATVSRYFSYELGRKDHENLKKIFSLTILIYIFLVLTIFTLGQTVGKWCFDIYLSIPQDRKNSAAIFYQFSLIGFLFNILSIPYSGLIISHENFKTISWISIGESIARLIIVYLLYESNFDRLSYYGALLCSVSGLIFVIYIYYCQKKYRESRFIFYWNKALCLDMLSFAGWNLWGATSGLFSNVLVNVLLNNYFGASVNAARGIAIQGATGVSNFVTNFLTATRPQIFKYYAENEYQKSINLTINSAKIGYFLLLIFAIPTFIEMDKILLIWLKEVPEYTSLFMRLILIQRLIEIISHPLVTLSQATGRIARYQTVVGVLQFSILPLSWISLELGGKPELPFLIAIFISILTLISQSYLISRIVENFTIRIFFQKTIKPALIITILSSSAPIIIMNTADESTPRLVAIFAASIAITPIFSYFLGLNKSEKILILSIIKNKLKLKK